jgi:hypothetical protein
MFDTVTAVPAYGRDYRSAEAVRTDWRAGKDFKCALTGQYLSERDMGGREVWVRYAKSTKTVKVQ